MYSIMKFCHMCIWVITIEMICEVMVLNKIIRMKEKGWDLNPDKSHNKKGGKRAVNEKQEEMVRKVGGKLRESDAPEVKGKGSWRWWA